MRQPNNKLSCNDTLFRGLDVGFYGMANLSSEFYPPPTCSLCVAFLEQQEKRFKPVRDPELVKDAK